MVSQRGCSIVTFAFCIALFWFVLFTAAFLSWLPVMMFLHKAEIGMQKSILVKQLGPPKRVLTASDLRQDDFWKNLGAKPPDHEVLEYWIHGFPHSDFVLVYVSESDKVTDFDFRNDDNLAISGKYDELARALHRVIYCWVISALAVVIIWGLRRKIIVMNRRIEHGPDKTLTAEPFSLPLYPEPGFTFDQGAAAFVKKKDDVLAGIFIKWAVVGCFVIMLSLAFYGLFRMIGYPWLEWTSLILLMSIGPSAPITMVVFYIVQQLQLPRARCGGCGERMRRKWSKAEGHKYLFLICPGCERYVNTGLSGLSLRGWQGKRQADEQGGPTD